MKKHIFLIQGNILFYVHKNYIVNGVMQCEFEMPQDLYDERYHLTSDQFRIRAEKLNIDTSLFTNEYEPIETQ